jgi:hypothetical protein
MAVDDLVADQSQRCQPRTVAMLPPTPRNDRFSSDRKESLPSGRFLQGCPPHTPHEVAVSAACTGSSDGCDFATLVSPAGAA